MIGSLRELISSPSDSDKTGGDQPGMTLVGHLTELRRRLIICLVAVAAGAVIVFMLFPQILGVLQGPYQSVTQNVERCQPNGCRLIATKPLAPFTVRLEVAGYGGLALAVPVVMWQIWRFVVPGLYPKERRYAIPFILSAVGLFLFGVFVAWLTVYQALDFLLIGSVEGQIEPFVTADEYLRLISLMLLGFGVAFELPLLLVFLLLVGVITTDLLRRLRRWAAVSITLFAGIITPSTDPITLLFMAIPMYAFYEIAILIGRIMKR